MGCPSPDVRRGVRRPAVSVHRSTMNVAEPPSTVPRTKPSADASPARSRWRHSTGSARARTSRDDWERARAVGALSAAGFSPSQHVEVARVLPRIRSNTGRNSGVRRASRRAPVRSGREDLARRRCRRPRVADARSVTEMTGVDDVHSERHSRGPVSRSSARVRPCRCGRDRAGDSVRRQR